MGLRDFGTVDLITDSPSGRRELWIVAAEWTPEREALDYVQLIIKLSNIESYAARLRGEVANLSLRVHSFEEPPASVVTFLQSRGVTATAGQPVSNRAAIGRPPRYPNLPSGAPDIDALQAANAETFARMHNLNGSVESMDAVDLLLEERRRAQGLAPEETDKNLVDGDLTVLAGAYAGQVIGQVVSGRWTIDAVGPLVIVHYVLEDGTRVNTLGKVSKYLQQGAEDSVRSLVSAVLAMV